MYSEEISKINKEITALFDKRNALYYKENSDTASKWSDIIENTLNNSPKILEATPIVACQGIDGANSGEACRKIFPMADIMYFNSFEGVFSAVENGMCEYGIVPIENSTAGSVDAIYDLMIKHNFYITKSVRLKIDHCLMAKPGTDIKDIKEVYSHEQALNQSTEYLKKLGAKLNVVENTAIAAKMVSESERNDIASVSSRGCRDIYGLSIIENSIQNQDNNYTRFICISKTLKILPGADKTSIRMVVPHKPGSLYKILQKAYELNINLIKLESRPIPNRDFEFMFYFDFETSVYSKEFIILLCELEKMCEKLIYLGSYSETI